MSQAKNWCFTLNNPDLFPNDVQEQLETLDLECAVFQLETGEQGTVHYQGFLILNKKDRLTALRGLFGGRAHWEIAKGTPAQNMTYCTKPGGIGEPCILGNFPEAGQGKRSDLDLVHSRLKHGLLDIDFSNEFFGLWVRYPNLVANYNAAQSRPRDQSKATRCVLYYGPSRVGKSRLAEAHASTIGAHYRKHPGKWWDNYCAQPSVVFDDFRGSFMSFTDFKLTVDRYPLRVEFKGSSRELEATNFFVTTNYPPSTWWDPSVTGGCVETIENRITEVYYMPARGLIKYYSSFREFSQNILTAFPENVPGPVLDQLVFAEDGSPSHSLPQTFQVQ